MASLVKKCRHKRAEWEECGCQWYVRQRVGGRDTYAPAGSDLVAAKRALASKEAGADETLSAALDAWLLSKERAPGARPNSIAAYRSRIVHVRARLGPNSVRSLRASNLTDFVDALLEDGFSPVYVQSIYNVLTSTLRHAQRRGVIAAVPTPVGGPGIPEPAVRDHSLTMAEVETIIGRLNGQWREAAELVLLTGLRWGELWGLRPDDVGDGVVHIRRTANRYGGVNPPKTKRGARVVPLSARAQQILEGVELPLAGDYTMAYDVLRDAMGNLHRDGMGWHTLRAAHASLLEAAGVTLRDQAARMGHGTNYAQTLAYGISQAGTAEALDGARRHASPPASPAPGKDELAARRARRSAQGE